MSKDIRIVPISEIRPNEKNRNVHSAEQIAHLVKQYKYQGFRNPIIVSNRSGLLVAGHGRLEAARKAGLTELPVIFQDFADEAQEYAYAVADNATAAWAELDLSGIGGDIPGLGPDFDIDLLGIKDFDLAALNKLEPQCDEDEVPEQVEPRTKLGDIYTLGRHRLVCGDSTSIDALEKLMAGELADLWLTDPPYGVAYKSIGAPDKHRAIENDSKPLEEMAEFWFQVAAGAFAVTSGKAAYYWFSCQGGNQMMMMMSISRAAWKVCHEIIWVKDQMVFGRSDYHYKHEPILYGWKHGGTHEWCADRKQTSVLEFPRPKSSDLHPTMKPVELVEYLMSNNTKPGQIVLDTFGGSGTTMIAAEKSGRAARLMELDLRYCDVIVARWEKYTGKKAELLNG